MSILKPNIPLKYVKPDGTTQSEYPLTSIDQVIDEDGIHRLNQTIVRADLSDVEEGQVVLTNADLLDNHPASYYATSEELNTKANKSDVLTLEEIQASTDLIGKIASASSVKIISSITNLSIAVPYAISGKDGIINNCKYISSLIPPFKPRMLVVERAGRAFVIGYTYEQSENTPYAQYIYFVIGENRLYLVSCYDSVWSVFTFLGANYD